MNSFDPQTFHQAPGETATPNRPSLDVRLAEKQRSSRFRLLGLLIGLFAVVLLIASSIYATRAVGVTVTPEEIADTALIEVVEGVAIVVGGDVYALTSKVALEVSANTFFPARVAIESTSASNYVQIQLLPKPATLVAALIPPNRSAKADESGTNTQTNALLQETKWLIDGEVASTGSQLEQSLPEGAYTLTVDNPYYELATYSVDLERAQLQSLNVELQALQGSATIASQPEGAQVFVNGQPLGRSDLGLQLSGGRYDIALRLPSYAEVTETVEITRAQQQLERRYSLIANPAYLEFEITPGNARLLVDGREVSNTTQSLAVSANTDHTVVLERDGYHPYSHTLQLAPGERQLLPLSLKPNIGSLRLEAQPVAQVSINGAPAGLTPLALELPATKQTIVFSKPGYHSISRTVTPGDNGKQLISVRLRTELNHRLATMPGQFVNSTGIALQRFTPNESFVLGAPRSEKGQRANESLRPVRLTKAFYVSRSEITNGQYQRFASGSRPSGAANLPKTNISWQQAAQFCNWLSGKDNLQPVYQFANGRYLSANQTADGYRLPTEAEWEWLARSANRRSATRFTWGDDYQVPAGAGNIADESAKGQAQFYVPQYNDGFSQTAPAGSFPTELSGLYDMSGNTSEWVHDYYTISTQSPGSATEAINPFGPTQGEGRVIKGSSFRSGNATQLRAAYRDSALLPRDDLGFRIVRYVYGKE